MAVPGTAAPGIAVLGTAAPGMAADQGAPNSDRASHRRPARTRCYGTVGRTVPDWPSLVPAVARRPATSRSCERLAPAPQPRTGPAAARRLAMSPCSSGLEPVAPDPPPSLALVQGWRPAMSRDVRSPPSKPAPDLDQPPARSRCSAGFGRTAPDRSPKAAEDPGRPPSPVPARPARSPCSAGLGRTAPGRPPNSDQDRRLRPAMTRCSAGAGETPRRPAGPPRTGPARTAGPARSDLARTADPARSDLARTGLARTGPEPAARTRSPGMRRGLRPGIPPRTGGAQQTDLAAAARRGPPAVAQARSGRRGRRTGRAPVETVHQAAPAQFVHGTPRDAARVGESGNRWGEPAVRST
jgi:hypothetical protein